LQNAVKIIVDNCSASPGSSTLQRLCGSDTGFKVFSHDPYQKLDQVAHSTGNGAVIVIQKNIH
jgi:hypothetical protein